MPSINHEGPIELIRSHPAVVVELVRCLTDIPVPRDHEVEARLGSNDATNVVPTEFTADSTVVLYSRETGKPVLIVVIEPQGRSAEEKTFAWPAYLANLRAAHKCERAVLIVVCWDEAEEDKCRKAIPQGHPGYVLVPIVTGPRSGPPLERASPWLTIFAGTMGAIDLETGRGRQMVLQAITATGSGTAGTRKLSAIILGVASDAARVALEDMMRTSPYRSEFIDSFVNDGIKQGKAKALVRVLKSRGIELTAQEHELVTSCPDPEQLDTWLVRASTATTASDVFKD